ncbi:hypothetical protein MRX96_000638 [Rhipicephalus microplus]
MIISKDLFILGDEYLTMPRQDKYTVCSNRRSFRQRRSFGTALFNARTEKDGVKETDKQVSALSLCVGSVRLPFNGSTSPYSKQLPPPRRSHFFTVHSP